MTLRLALAALIAASAAPAWAQDEARKGWEALEAGDLLVADLCFRKALLKNADDADALAGAGVIRCRAGEYEKGLAKLRRARELGCTYGHLDLELGRALFMTDDTEAAIPRLEAHRAAHPDAWQTYEILGLCYSKAGAWAKCVEALTHESLKAHPENEPMRLHHLRLAYEQLGEPEKAEARAKRLVDEFPDTPYARQTGRPAPGAEARLWYVLAGVEGQFDTNPLSIGEDALVPGSLAGKETWNLQAYGGVGIRIVREPDAYWGVEARHLANWHDGLSTFDQNLTSVSTYGEHWIEEWAGLFGSGGWSTLEVGDTHTRDTWSVGAGALFAEAAWTRTRLAYGFTNTEFFLGGLTRAQDLDSAAHSLGVTQEIAVPDTDLRLTVGYSHVFQNAEGRDYDADFDRVFVQASHPLGWEVRLLATLSWAGGNYRHGNSRDPAGRSREDDAWTAALRVERPLCDFATVYLAATVINNESRLGVFDYDRNVYALGMDVRY